MSTVDNTERIVLGSGYIYTTEYTGQTMPADSVIETEANRLGLIQGGATLEYTPTKYTAKDDMGKVSKTILTSEEVILKSGIMTWCGNTLEKLCETARVTETETERTVKIGGVGNATGKLYLIRFVHPDNENGDIRITIVGNNEAGFSMAFAADAETVIDAEFKAHPMDADGTLIEYREKLNTEA